MVGDNRQYQREPSPNDRRLYEAAEDATRADKRGLWRDAEEPVADLDYYVQSHMVPINVTGPLYYCPEANPRWWTPHGDTAA